MCIAIASPIGVNPPDIETLHTCWDNNDDGAGFAFPLPNNCGVKIMKGFMSWNDFKDAWEEFTSHYDVKNNPILIHFRIATHGSRGQDMTHPFPIQYDEGALKKIEYVSDYAVIHNGIISCTNQYRSTSGLSDTATFCKEYLTLFTKFGKTWLHHKETMQLIYKMINSKMAIIDKDGFLNMTEGFEEFQGNFFSNTSYKENRYRYNNNTPYYYYNYNDDYDDDYDYSCGYDSGIRHYQFNNSHDKKSTNKVINNDNIYDFTYFDSDYNDYQRGLMSMHIGWTISSDDGFNINIDTQKDIDTIFIDRKRNVWERVSEDIIDKNTGEVVNMTVGFNLIAENGHVFSQNGKEMSWNCDTTVENSYFVENW